MNRTLCALTALLIAAIPGIRAAAGEPISSRSYQEEPVGFGAGALAGAIIAGPPGMLVGAGVGVLMGRQLGMTKEFDKAEDELMHVRKQVTENRYARDPLARAGHAAAAPTPDTPPRDSLRAITDGLWVTIAFRTASHAMEPQYEGQLRMLAQAFSALPALHITLDGHTDARGSRRFNQKLSQQRVAAVRRLLIDAGVSRQQIETAAHGELHALYANGDREGYPFDRRVLLKFKLIGDE